MDLNLDFVCIIRPWHIQFVRAVTIWLTLVAVALSGVVAVTRVVRQSGGPVHRATKLLHLALLVSCFANFGAVAFDRFVTAEQFVSSYEAEARKPAPSVRSAMHREFRIDASVSAIVLVILASSFAAWQWAGRRSSRQAA
jgi:hypothetical protein